MGDNRLLHGFLTGLIATGVMSVLMLIGFLSGVAPMPSPVPVAIMDKVLGAGAAMPVKAALGTGAHLLYGAIWGSVLAALTARVTLLKGVTLGILLWLIMELLALPFVGWGLFGLLITPKIAAATLVLHLVYGAAYGWLMDSRLLPTRPYR